jgi:hypothetical protein
MLIILGSGLCQFITFSIFGSFDILYDKPFEIILQPSDEGQIYLKGGLSGNTLFFYLSDKHFGVCVRGAPLNPDGPYFAESEQYASYYAMLLVHLCTSLQNWSLAG